MNYPSSPFSHEQVHSLSREDLAAAVCNALTVVALGHAAVGQSLIHQIQVSLDTRPPDTAAVTEWRV